jgi:hypothetical protein
MDEFLKENNNNNEIILDSKSWLIVFLNSYKLL